MSGIGNWKKRVHKRSMSDSKLDKRFWSFTPSPLGSRNYDNDSIGGIARTRRETDAMDGPKKIEDAAIILHSDATDPSTNAPMNATSDDHNMPPIDEPSRPPPKSRKIIQDPYAMLEEEERAEKLLMSRPTAQSTDPNASLSTWSKMHDLGYADFQGFVLGPIHEREPDENRLIALPPPPRHKKNTETKVQPRKRRPRMRQASSLPNSPTFRDTKTGDHKNIGTSHQESNETLTKKIPRDIISQIEIGIVSDGQGRGEGLMDGIELHLDENSGLSPGVAGGLDWPLAWQWSPIGSINLEAGYEAEMGQVDSAHDSSSSRKEQLQSTNRDQAPRTTSLAASLTLPSASPSPPSPTLLPRDAESWSDRGGREKIEMENRMDGTSLLKDGQRAWQRRPLLSHGTSASISSQGQSIMTDDGPASTVENEPRISISSTVYQASSNDHSHSHSLYHTPMPDRPSFIDLHSPMQHEFHYGQPSPEPVSPISFAESPHSPDLDFGFPRPPKPPVPTAPKPHIHRPHSRQSSPMAETPPHSGVAGERKKKKSLEQEKTLPPTTNFLDTDERAELIRKSRKLARVFGETPGADAFAQDAWRPSGKPLHLGGSVSSRRHSLPLSPEDVSFLSIGSPTFDVTGTKKDKKGKKSAKDKERSTSKDRALKKALPSPTSFIDLSDEEHVPSVTATKPRLHANVRGLSSFASAPTSPLSERTGISGASGISRRPPSPTQSLMSTLTVDTIMPDPEEEERRRKRERLAKLHRFLGSRVPANLVLGFDEREDEATLPPLDALSPLSLGGIANDGANTESPNSSKSVKPAWMKRRRSSSAGLLPSFRLGDPSIQTPLDRQCEELDDKEKALNVRRAHKMEQVFGVAPPQTLFHTRQAASSSPAIISPASNLPKGSATKKSTPPSSAPLIALPQIPSIGAFSDVLLIQRTTNINRSSYNSRKSSKVKRPGSADSKESSRQTLLPGPSEIGHGSHFDDREFGHHGAHGNDADGGANLSPQVHHSFVYNHYQHSLNSLNDILDRDDRESLAELHDYLNSTNLMNTTNADTNRQSPNLNVDGQLTKQDPEQPQLRTRDRSASIASSLKSARRRSLPSRTSMISFSSSELSISTVSSISSSYTVQQANEFQQRRRRAAKLAQFFGVNYRELVNEVLESIESGVAQEHQRGTLRAEEVEDLLTKLRTLKVKRSRLF